MARDYRWRLDLQLPPSVRWLPKEHGPTAGLEPTRGPEPAWPLVLFDAAGLQSMTQGHGIALPLRLGLEAMMQAPLFARTHGVLVTVRLRDMVDWLWPNGWHATRDPAC